MAVKIRHGFLYSTHHRANSERPEAYGRALWITYPDGTGRRYEFDYDEKNIYVYCGHWDTFGEMTGWDPIRSIPRR